MTKREKLVLSPKSAVSTGSTLLNLACTDHPECGFMKGKYYYLVGDSTSGKTWLSLTCFAEACLNKTFRNYDLIFDDVEGGALMDVEYYFGKEVARRMRTRSSETVEDFYYFLRDLFKRGKPFILVLDSQDALDSLSARKKLTKQKAAAESGEKASGSFGDGKAKYHSQNIRWVLSGLRKTESILLIIGQTRDNPNAFGFADKKTRSGGKSLRYYATIEIWTSVGKKLVKMVRGAKRTVGVRCLAEAKKNRVTGKIGRDRTVEIPIYNGLGIDDVGSCVDFLIDARHWQQRKRKTDGVTEYRVKDLDFIGSRREIINYVERSSLEGKLRQITANVWHEIEKECMSSDRKRRYE